MWRENTAESNPLSERIWSNEEEGGGRRGEEAQRAERDERIQMISVTATPKNVLRTKHQNQVPEPPTGLK